MTGRLIAVVGPSGVGKDTAMAALSLRCPRLHRVRRVVTRPAEAGGEPFEGVTEAAFADRLARGDFLLSWRAHGLSYGIPRTVLARLGAGQDLLANLSRRVLVEAQAKVPRLTVLALRADPAVLAARLRARGREAGAALDERLRGREIALPPGIDTIRIDNSGALDDTVAAALDALYPVKV